MIFESHANLKYKYGNRHFWCRGYYVDAMEKMDEIQDSLEMLNRAFDDVKIIRNEYTRYNQYMLAKKALGYLNKKQEVEREQGILEGKEQLQREAQEEQSRAAQDTERLAAEKKLKEAGLVPEYLGEDDSVNEYGQGQVSYQSISAGTQVEKGTTVQYKVSKGSQPSAPDSGNSGNDSGTEENTNQ